MNPAPSPDPITPRLRLESPVSSLAPASVILGFPANRLDDVEREWVPARRVLAEAMVRVGRHLENQHWNWPQMYRSGEHCLIAIEAAHQIQGLMAVETQLHHSALTAGGWVVYADFIEVAPWNVTTDARPRQYGRTGELLLRAVILLSLGTAAGGRVGLHSLPQAEQFYRNCQMVDLGTNPDYGDLVHFEYTRATALHRVGGVGG